MSDIPRPLVYSCPACGYLETYGGVHTSGRTCPLCRAHLSACGWYEWVLASNEESKGQYM